MDTTPLIPSNNPVNLAELAQGRRQMQPTGIGGAAWRNCCHQAEQPPGTERGWRGERGQGGQGSPRAGLLGAGGVSPQPHNPRGRAAFSPSENQSHFQKENRFWLGGEGSRGPRIEGNSGRNSDSLLHSK